MGITIIIRIKAHCWDGPPRGTRSNIAKNQELRHFVETGSQKLSD
jgi:hypothetical protein